MASETADEYEFRTFPAAAPDGRADEATRNWLEAESRGFHESRKTAEAIDLAAVDIAADGRRLTGAYTTTAPESALGPDVPVATFAAYEHTLNVGGAELLPAHLIAGVTVRPTHRRRGLLRRLMSDDLTAAHAAGHALAALTVSEATIYRRFGFGIAYGVDSATVPAGQRFRLTVPTTGRCELIDARDLVSIAPRVFSVFHARTPGSVDRQHAYWRRSAGLAGPNGAADDTVRAAVHYGVGGAIDGYAAYRVHEGDRTTELEVIDLVAGNDGAYLGLWELLGSMDLVDTVRFDAAPADDPLRWALADWRAVRTTSRSDRLWIRLLDVVAAFEARGYLPGVEGEVVVEVADDLGFAAGRYRIRVVDGRASVTQDRSAEPDLELEAWVLGSLYLGAVDARTLASAGRIVERTVGAVDRFATLLTPVRPVYGVTHF